MKKNEYEVIPIFIEINNRNENTIFPKPRYSMFDNWKLKVVKQ